jgi:hypothetical protein
MVQAIVCPTGKSRPTHQNLSNPRAKNISLFPKPKSVVMFAPSRPDKRAYRDRHGRWAGMRWTRQRRARGVVAGRAFHCVRPVSGQAARGRTMLYPASMKASADWYQAVECLLRRRPRTAKPCGPGTHCWCQVRGGEIGPTGLEAPLIRATTVTTRTRSPGRARYKLLKPLCREGRVNPAPPVATTVCLLPLHTGCGCGLSTRLSLRPLCSRDIPLQSSGIAAARMRTHALGCLTLKWRMRGPPQPRAGRCAILRRA